MHQELYCHIRMLSDSDSIDYREVDLDTIEMSRPRSVGGEHVTLEALRSLELDKKLGELGFNGPQTAAAIGTIIGRACAPGSETGNACMAPGAIRSW